MTVQLELWQMISLLLAFFGAVWAFGVALLKQIDKRLDERFDHMEEVRAEDRLRWAERITTLETNHAQAERDFSLFRAELPEKYVRRDDWVRNQTIIEAKLDGLAAHMQNMTLRAGQ